MKKNKILIGALSLTTLAPIVPLVLTSCGQPDTTKKYTVTLYAGDGYFANDEKQLVLNNVPEGTRLMDIPGFSLPTYTPVLEWSEYEFAYWADAYGNIVNNEYVVKDNTILGAYFKDKPQETSYGFKLDSWATVAKNCATARVFAATYLNETYQDEAQAVIAIKTAIKAQALKETKDEELIKEIYIANNVVSTSVRIRLIDVIYDPSATDKQTKFVFEFVDTIDSSAFDLFGNNFWYDKTTDSSCLLRYYLNYVVYNALPISIQEKILTTERTTVSEKEGRKITSQERIFILSNKEYGILEGKDKFNETIEQFSYYSALNGNPFFKAQKYYLGYDGIYKGKPEASDPSTIIATPYWLRTVDDDTESNYAWRFNSTTDSSKLKMEKAAIESPQSIAPAFYI